MADLYLTYSIRERYWVSKLVKALEHEGYSVWWDHAVISGVDFRNDSQLALTQAKCALAVWSPTAVKDHWVLVDSEQAQKKQALISVLAEDCEIPDVFKPLELTNLKDWTLGDKQSVHFKSLLETIKAYCLPSLPPQNEQEQLEIARLERMRAENEYKRQLHKQREALMIRKRMSI